MIIHRKLHRGAALIIVLALIVLLAAMVVAYFARTINDSQSARISYLGSDADQLARSALDVIVADLKQEIAAGSLPTPTPPALPVYLPTPAANAIPKRSGVPVGVPDPLPNLVKRSVSPDNIASPGVPSRASAINSTTAISTNNRSVALARWNKHYLLPRFNTGTTIDYTPPSPLPAPFNPNPPVATGFTPPDWVLVTRAGPAIETGIGSGDLAVNNPNPANSNYVVGRYAFAVYDEGGLLDVNVAGFPSNTTAAQFGRKGPISFADLTQLSNLPQVPQIDRIVGWRNLATAQATPSPTPGAFPIWNFDTTSASRYVTAVLSNTTGFLTVNNLSWVSNGTARTDQSFVTRQELLQFRTDTKFTQNALQYLGTFSRELNQPSWSPDLNAIDMGAANNGVGNIYAYRDNSTSPTAINRNLNTVRVTTAFTRFDGSLAQVGAPLLATRFPLTRLSWLTYKGPSADVYAANNNDPVILALLAAHVSLQTIQAGTKANIKACFGLVWDSRSYVASPRQGLQWVYTSPSSANSGGTFNGTSGTAATALKTLATIQTEGREPDFFEIVKAAILNGSVGLGSNNTANTFVAANPNYYDTTNGKSSDYQLIQIGANIMDAWDTDNIPTWINFNASEPTGIENLPYLNKLVFMPSFASGSGDFFDAWLVPSLWNPHQNAPGTGTIRVALNGTAQLWGTGIAKSGSTTTTTTAGPISPLPATMDVSAAGFAVPSPQTTTPINRTTSVTQVTDPSLPYWGFHFPFTATTPFATLVTKQDADSAFSDFGSVLGASTVELQVQIPSTATFVPYESWNIAAIGHPLICQGAKNNFGSNNKLQDPEFFALDPRTVRFGVWGSNAIGQTGPRSTKDYTQGEKDSLDEQNPAKRFEQITLYAPQPNTPSTAPFKVSSFPSSMYLYCTNDQATDFYKDIDGVQRFADYASNNGITQGSTIMYGTNSADRARIPSAPFQSVAELAQVFRDQPWKTLNLTSASPNATSRSGDAGLLDVFTLQEISMTAGKTALNTRQAPVLNAILSQVTKMISGGSALTGSTVSNISAALVNFSSATPMINKSEIVTRLAADSSVTGLGNKEAREAVVRALCDATQTRTWNLMIDVIAQSGRYPPTATDLSQFIVEGEKRYWLHIAIDRFTGEVIDQQLEAVYE